MMTDKVLMIIDDLIKVVEKEKDNHEYELKDLDSQWFDLPSIKVIQEDILSARIESISIILDWIKETKTDIQKEMEK